MRLKHLISALTVLLICGGSVKIAPAASENTAGNRLWARGLTSHVEAQRLDRDTFAHLAAATSPGVVNIFTTEEVRRRGLPLVPFSPLIPGLSYAAGSRTSLGTGFIINAEGYIATNRHVIGDAVDIQVHLHDGTTYAATVVDMLASRLDLMLLKIEAEKPLPVLAFGETENLRVGDWVMAIGNAFGLGHTVTTGTISNLIRVTGVEVGGDETHHLGIIQTDASINPGNSGGPLLNLDGHVIGINTAMLRGSENIGFALDIDSVKRQLPTLDQLAIRPAVSHGATFVLLSAEEAETRYGSRALVGRLKVVKIRGRSPAARAGLRSGDVILAVEERQVETFSDMQAALVAVGPGVKMTWQIRRKNRNRTLTVIGESREP